MYFLIILMFLTASFNFATEPGFKELLKKGDEAYDNFNNISAIEYYEKAYKLDSDNYDILLRLAKAYNSTADELFITRQKDKADPYIVKAVYYSELLQEKFPDSAASYAYLSMAYGTQAQVLGNRERIKMAKKVEENSLKAIEISPDFYLPYVILGIYYREIAKLSWIERTFANAFFGKVPEGSFEDSEKMLKRALAIDPDLMIAAVSLARTYRAKGDKKMEKIYLEKAVKMPVRDFRDKHYLPFMKKRLEELN
jgi:tetratricopeptide (TPR) repeat protein